MDATADEVVGTATCWLWLSRELILHEQDKKRPNPVVSIKTFPPVAQLIERGEMCLFDGALPWFVFVCCTVRPCACGCSRCVRRGVIALNLVTNSNRKRRSYCCYRGGWRGPQIQTVAVNKGEIKQGIQ